MYKRICATNTIYKHTTNTVLLYNNNNKNIYCTTNTIYNRRTNELVLLILYIIDVQTTRTNKQDNIKIINTSRNS